ncbi:hypothetical protein PHLCEN_2v10981 [Hermanssonia centrifuga]|uniref:Uncharacterized protein n=1 Tax=Hermanssonia centrifuga TaxID=98765 RepID=A0A2R6NLA7_9APHY|nr:hypothetical protein PHLCEN_2v10981 [Hermanssonia centrifuga]
MSVSDQSTTLASRQAILSVFEAFRDELDDGNDRRERLIKVRLWQSWVLTAVHLTYFSW